MTVGSIAGRFGVPIFYGAGPLFGTTSQRRDSPDFIVGMPDWTKVLSQTSSISLRQKTNAQLFQDATSLINYHKKLIREHHPGAEGERRELAIPAVALRFFYDLNREIASRVAAYHQQVVAYHRAGSDDDLAQSRHNLRSNSILNPQLARYRLRELGLSERFRSLGLNPQPWNVVGETDPLQWQGKVVPDALLMRKLSQPDHLSNQDFYDLALEAANNYREVPELYVPAIEAVHRELRAGMRESSFKGLSDALHYYQGLADAGLLDIFAELKLPPVKWEPLQLRDPLRIRPDDLALTTTSQFISVLACLAQGYNREKAKRLAGGANKFRMVLERYHRELAKRAQEGAPAIQPQDWQAIEQTGILAIFKRHQYPDIQLKKQ